MKISLFERIENVANFNQEHSVLSNWEVGFVESIASFTKKHGKLSDSQYRVFAKVEAKCDPAVVRKTQEWAASYDDEKRAIATTCAKYYIKTRYWTQLASQILSDPEFVPTYQQYTRMCENKYAKKVLENANAAPLYPVGSTVMLRTPAARSWPFRKLQGKPCLVIEVLEEILNSAKGSKRYSILPYGSPTPHIFEERQIKKWKKIKKKTPKKTDTSEEIPF